MPDATDQDDSPAAAQQPRAARRRLPSWHALRATSTRRTLLLTALGGLLIAGVVTAVPSGDTGPGRLVGYMVANPVPSTGVKSNEAFNRATSGDCLMWPENLPEAASIVECKDEHRFEVAESIDMRTFPGSEYGPDSAPPSAARIEQISQEQCEAAVRRYLGNHYDPNSKFSISMLWSGDRAWRQSGDRRVLCGLQLPGPNNQQAAFQGRVANLDQSKVWPAGTCLGIDPATNQPTDTPVDCAGPHAMEVTGSVNLAERFPGALPPEPEQDTFIKDSCTRLTEAYLAPVQLRNTTLTLTYNTVSLPSWAAGSREVSCSIGATLGNGGWATLLNSAKGPLLINGQPPIPPPEIPQERLNPPPIPVPPVPLSQGTSTASTGQRPGNQHLPHQPAEPAPQSPPQPAPAVPPSPGAEAPPPAAAGGEPPPPPPPAPMEAPPAPPPPAPAAPAPGA
ncbi:putative membrane protein [Mycobacterium botniense]|uniref:Putative membrane protein n=2 Tax=Mycobacterium botniense TaxID=84962 RepID=A0A7I9XTI0_9MYCO|nr:putative membrane protein [Mycobacterium botniense]